MAFSSLSRTVVPQPSPVTWTRSRDVSPSLAAIGTSLGTSSTSVASRPFAFGGPMSASRTIRSASPAIGTIRSTTNEALQVSSSMRAPLSTVRTASLPFASVTQSPGGLSASLRVQSPTAAAQVPQASAVPTVSAVAPPAAPAPVTLPATVAKAAPAPVPTTTTVKATTVSVPMGAAALTTTIPSSVAARPPRSSLPAAPVSSLKLPAATVTRDLTSPTSQTKLGGVVVSTQMVSREELIARGVLLVKGFSSAPEAPLFKFAENYFDVPDQVAIPPPPEPRTVAQPQENMYLVDDVVSEPPQVVATQDLSEQEQKALSEYMVPAQWDDLPPEPSANGSSAAQDSPPPPPDVNLEPPAAEVNLEPAAEAPRPAASGARGSVLVDYSAPVTEEQRAQLAALDIYSSYGDGRTRQGSILATEADGNVSTGAKLGLGYDAKLNLSYGEEASPADAQPVAPLKGAAARLARAGFAV